MTVQVNHIIKQRKANDGHEGWILVTE